MVQHPLPVKNYDLQKYEPHQLLTISTRTHFPFGELADWGTHRKKKRDCNYFL